MFHEHQPALTKRPKLSANFSTATQIPSAMDTDSKNIPAGAQADGTDEQIYHYTSMQSLALILSSTKIRFTRLDCLDDVHEAQKTCGVDFGKFLFVSCWTVSPTEQIPLWNMYTPQMAGVRLAVPRMPFLQKEIHPLPGMKIETDNASVANEGPFTSPFDWHELSTDKHCILPTALVPDVFAGIVEYVDDPHSHWTKHVAVVQKANGKYDITMNNFAKLPRYKTSCWKFQEEYRFVLMVLPPIDDAPRFGTDLYATRIANHVTRCFVQRIHPEFSHFDVTLSDLALNKLQVTTGPKAGLAEKTLLKSLLSTYTPNATLSDSALAGSIKTPVRG